MRTMIATACLGCFSLALLASAQDERPKGQPVPKVIDVKTEIKDGKLEITAFGQVPTGGWKVIELKRVGETDKTPPKDGIAEFEFLVERPTGIVTQAFALVTAKHTWANFEKEGAWVKGIRVYGQRSGVKEIAIERK